jgi:hypothetical protein
MSYVHTDWYKSLTVNEQHLIDYAYREKDEFAAHTMEYVRLLRKISTMFTDFEFMQAYAFGRISEQPKDTNIEKDKSSFSDAQWAEINAVVKAQIETYMYDHNLLNVEERVINNIVASIKNNNEKAQTANKVGTNNLQRRIKDILHDDYPTFNGQTLNAEEYKRLK